MVPVTSISYVYIIYQGEIWEFKICFTKIRQLEINCDIDMPDCIILLLNCGHFPASLHHFQTFVPVIDSIMCVFYAFSCSFTHSAEMICIIYIINTEKQSGNILCDQETDKGMGGHFGMKNMWEPCIVLEQNLVAID